jgi:hypothetical protein
MAMEQDVQRVEHMLDDLYGGGSDCVPADEISKRAERATLAPDMMYYFDKDRLRDDCDSRQDLVRQVNGMIEDRGRQQEVGLIH